MYPLCVFKILNIRRESVCELCVSDFVYQIATTRMHVHYTATGNSQGALRFPCYSPVTSIGQLRNSAEYRQQLSRTVHGQ